MRWYLQKAWTRTVGAVRDQFLWLQLRYGARYTRVMVGAALVTLFLPVPGISVGCVVAVVLVAEAHRAVGLTICRGRAVTLAPAGNGRMRPREHVMPSKCEVIVAWGATTEQLTAVGTALWRWCVRGVGYRDLYQYVNNQLLADLIAGRFPAAGPVDRRGFHFRLWDMESNDASTRIATLQRELPGAGVVDFVVDDAGRSRDDLVGGHILRRGSE
jgi:hypothetical protein